MPLAYANPHSDGMYNYFHYTIDEGETIQMTLCYYVKIDDIPLDELYLEITTQCKYVCKECGSSNEWTNSLGRGNNYSLDFQHMYAGWLFVFEKFGYYK